MKTKTIPARWRLELAVEAARGWAMEAGALLRNLEDEELEEFCAEFAAAPPVPPDLDVPFGPVYEAARVIAKERLEKLSRLRSALGMSDTETALEIAGELCGVNKNEKSNRVNPRIH